MRARPLITALLAVAAAGCAEEPGSDAWLLAEGERYLADGAFRREALLASLESRENVYAQERIANYGLGDRGWDTLPAWNPRSARVTAEVAAARAAGAPIELPPVWDGETPVTMEGWVALGREVFFRYPLRADPYVEHAIARPELDVGVARDARGEVIGAVVFRDAGGEERVGLTCALCHTAVRDGEAIAGAARRELDYGALRIAYHDATGRPIDDALRARMARWGPGRADITADVTEDPVAIPDLWGLRSQRSLTQAGTIRHASPAALAIRQETQYLHANHQRTRPPRELAFALAMYLYSLAPPAPPPMDEAAARGAAIFEAACASCHEGDIRGGVLVRAETVGTDPALARGEARGTGMYRTPSLLAVRDAAPYFHDGTVPTLEDVLSPARFDPGYAGNPRGPGPVPGHAYGMALRDFERSDLLAYLRSL